MTNRSTRDLFHRKTLNTALRTFSFPADLETRRDKVQKWIDNLNAGTLDEIKEVSLHGNFLNDIFQDVLGYRSIIQSAGKVWEIHAEQTILDGGGSADAALGFFTANKNNKGKGKIESKIVAPIELKGAKNDLDRAAPGRKESAVDQGWRYANYTPDCRWIIVSNYRELRLYQTSKTPAYYERFLMTELADLEAFKRFYFLLCRQNFLPSQNKPQAVSAIDVLLKTSDEAQEEITKVLYEEYKAIRLNLVKHFRFAGPQDIPNRDQVLIEKAQKTLDRFLFVAFCEDKGLLPPKTISNAHDHSDPYNPRPIWERYKAVFRWVDVGNDDPPIPGYNGGLFQLDPILDERLTVPDPLCSQINRITRFDFDTEVSVDILGHIFEQSVTDLEELKAANTGQKFDEKKGKRKTQGVFYTPAYITQYIVEVALGSYLNRREQEMRDLFQLNHLETTRDNEIKFWEAYRDRVLQKTRVIDPACGSGAFLIAAFDYLIRQYERVNQNLIALGNRPSQGNSMEFDRAILSNNLYGVDLLSESVEITKLSLWLKTAESGKTLTYLDDNIKVGNSIVADSQVAERAFNWETEFPHIFADGGFDVVIGNPPYVRQELLSTFKPYLKANYESFDGVADLYTYFYEKGLKLLKSGGILSYIVTNKWLRSGYGEPLRGFFANHGVLEQIIDFGHAPIFEDADTFPCIVAVRKPVLKLEIPPYQEGTKKGTKLSKSEPQSNVIICPIPREDLAGINLSQYVQQNSYQIPWLRFNADAWSLEPPAVDELMQKIQRVGLPLKDFAGVKPLYGIKTGLNEAFLIDEATKNSLVETDPKSAEILKPYLRGQDIKRWSPEWANLWMITSYHGIDIDVYPAIKNYLTQYQISLEPRPKNWDTKINGEWLGRKAGNYKWYELQDNITQWQSFEQPKIIYQVIQTLPYYAWDNSGAYGNDKTFILPSTDLCLLGWLNSPLIWWYSHRVFTKMLSGAISPMGYLFEKLPIAPPTDEIRAEVEPIVSRLIEITKANQETHRDVIDWLKITYRLDKPGQKLEDFSSLTIEELIAEIRKRMPKSKSSDPLGVAGLKAVRETYNQYVPEVRTRKAEALKLEQRLSELVNQAYGLTPEEIDLMWKTAPPRMPIDR